jgi:hypothetical protein
MFIMPTANIKDFNIRGIEHPKYNKNRIIEDRPIEFIVQKLENILFTNHGDVLGDLSFGANLEYYLWSTNVSASRIKREIQNQIDNYLSELNNIDYEFSVDLYEGTVRDILYVNFKIKDVDVDFVLS